MAAMSVSVFYPKQFRSSPAERGSVSAGFLYDSFPARPGN